MPTFRILRFLMLAAALMPSPTTSLPDSFCKYSTSLSNNDANFCLTVSTHHNTKTRLGDIHINFTHDRYHDSPLGWTAFGPGSLMNGALMFIVYGDPSAASTPTVSVRSAGGHEQPVQIARREGLELEMTSQWENISAGHSRATVDIVCSGCTSWTGTEIALTDQQSFIWAFNPDQNFGSEYPSDAELAIHGRSALSFGTIYLGLTDNGSSPSLTMSGGKGLLWTLHGILTTMACLIFLPLGYVAIRSGASSSFRFHWISQVLAGSMTLVGISIALFLHPRIIVAHHYLGSALGLMLLVQAFLGYRHHTIFLKVKKATRFSKIHTWLGRLLLVGGYMNVLLGLRLGSHRSPTIILAACAELLGTIVMILVWWRSKAREAALRNLSLHKKGEMQHMVINSESSIEDGIFGLAEYEDEDVDAD